MRKELIWAGIFGITFGLVIGFGAWRVHSSVVSDNKPLATSTPQAPAGQAKIVINTPENYSVITASPLTVTGVTKPLTWVVVSAEDEDYLIQSLDNGTWEAKAQLNSGVNFVDAASINNEGNTSSQNVTIVYSSSFQTSSPTPDTATDEAELDKAVALRVAQAEKPPRAYLGTVTDIAESTIQIKTTDSQIQQVSTDTLDVTVVNTTGTTNKTVKLTDIAIGDFIVAMGYIDGDDVLDAQRILISDSPAEKKIVVNMYKVNSVNKKSLTLTPVAGGDSIDLTPDKNTSIKSYTENTLKTLKFSGISENDLLIVTSDTTGSPSVTRAIFDIGNL